MENNQSEQNMEAAKAWQLMQGLLEKEMPVDNGSKNNKRKYTLLLLILLIGGCGIYKLYNGHNGGIGALSYDAINKEKNKTEKLSANAPLVDNSTTEKQKKRADRNEILQSDKSKAIEKSMPVENTNQQQTAKTDNAKTIEQPTGKIFKNNSNNFIKKEKNNTNAPDNILTQTAPTQRPTINTGASSNTQIPQFAMMPAKNEKNVNTNKQTVFSKENKTVKQNEVAPVVKSDFSIKESRVKAGVVNKNETSHKNTYDSVINQQVAKLENGKMTKTTIKIPVVKSRKKLHFGLEWSTALPFGNSTVFKEVNGKNQPLTILIPALWISKELSAKSTFLLSFNPYTQYLLNKRSALQTSNYAVSATSAAAISQPANTVFIDQTFTLSKVMGIEVALQYAYQVSRYWSVGAAVGNTWTTNALLNEKLVRNSTDVLKDSLYGVVKTDKDWQYINSHFVTGKIYVAYQLKHYQFGAAFSKPITSVFGNTAKENRPVNAQVFLRWSIK